MPRKATGKPLTLFPIRVDEDVKAAILSLKDKHETINEGLRSVLLNGVRLDDDVWEAVKAMDESLNQFLRNVLIDGIGITDDPEKIQKALDRPFKGPLLKPSERK